MLFHPDRSIDPAIAYGKACAKCQSMRVFYLFVPCDVYALRSGEPQRRGGQCCPVRFAGAIWDVRHVCPFAKCIQSC